MPWRVVSVRGYFLTIITAALLAALVLILDLTTQQRRQLTAAAGQDAHQLARLAAAAHERALAETQQTLELLARFPQVRSGEGCGALLAELRQRMPRYLDLGVARPDGQVLCSAQPRPGRGSIADRAWFRSAVEWRTLGIGEYRVERATGRPAVTVAAPVLDLRGRLPAVVFAAVDLVWLRELAAAGEVAPEAVIAVIDRDGSVLARQPPADGARVEGSLVRSLTAAGSGVVETTALDGRARLVGFTRVGARENGGGAYVIVAVPVPSMVAAGRAVVDGVAWIALIGVLGLVAAVIGSEMLLRRRIEHLVATTRRLAAGDFAARTGWNESRSELGQVAQAFDEMAAALEGLTRRTQLILEAVSEAIVGVDGDERVTFVNPLAAALLGLPAAHLVGRSLHGALREATSAAGGGCALCAAMEQGVAQQSNDGVLVRPDRTAVPVDYICTPKHNGGRAAGAVIALKDISTRKRAEQERQRRRDTLHQRDKLASMATLLADVAHELNNPLTVIIAGATLLRDATRDEAVRRRAELLEQAAERCALTIRNFLALVRQYPATREEVALERIVKETLALVAYQLEVDEVSVDVSLPLNVPPVWADPHQLHQVVLNLVTNARHALRTTAPPRRLFIGLRHDIDARRVVLEVADSGPGVPPELRAFVFRPFFTTKSPEEGTGLGLALCHDIVAAHGGAIRVDSAAGGGALFVVELPLDRPEEVAAPAPVPAARPVRLGRVLVVDDDRELASVLAAALRAEGHDVEIAVNGLEALEVLERGRFDVILTDVRMPKLDGPGLYRELQQRHPDLVDRVVFVTGDILGRETAAFLERTRAAHLTKPFDIKQVRRVVAEVLGAS
ncbi:MAG TPA: ATP-binding protein [Methylomirabilota bacterium]|jgi:PAS domain S-box-containing protein